MISLPVSLLRLVLALLLGGLVGWERETHDRPAGFRTHILVTIGSTLLMIISIRMVELYPDTADPGRIAAQVVSGMGFLGAGTIIREGLSVKGLTTAASLWAVAAIGLASGAGYYYVSIFTTLLVFMTLFFFSRVDINIESNKHARLGCLLENKAGMIGNIGLILGSEGININNLRLEKEESEEQVYVELDLIIPRKYKRTTLNQKLFELDGLIELNWLDI